MHANKSGVQIPKGQGHMYPPPYNMKDGGHSIVTMPPPPTTHTHTLFFYIQMKFKHAFIFLLKFNVCMTRKRERKTGRRKKKKNMGGGVRGHNIVRMHPEPVPEEAKNKTKN